MSLSSPLSDFIVCQIVPLKNLGFSYKRIADQLGLHNRFTARNGYQLYLKNEDFYSRKSSGRPKKFTVREERHILRVIKNNPRGTPKVQVDFTSFSTFKSISAVTFRRKYGLNGLQQKPYLIGQSLVRKRVKWCHERRNWTAEQRKNVAFLDECRFRLKSDGNVSIWRPKRERFNSKYNRSFSPDRRSIKFWSIIESDGTRRFFECPEPFKSAEYIKTLDSLKDTVFGDGVRCLQDDNAPIHYGRH